MEKLGVQLAHLKAINNYSNIFSLKIPEIQLCFQRDSVQDCHTLFSTIYG